MFRRGFIVALAHGALQLTAAGETAPRLALSQTDLTVSARPGSIVPHVSRVGVLNEGSGRLVWTARAKTSSGGDWLSVLPTDGAVERPMRDVAFLEVHADPTSLEPGVYNGVVEVRAVGAITSRMISVVFTVGGKQTPEVFPTGLVFLGPEGSSPPSRKVVVSGLEDRLVAYRSSSLTLDGQRWLWHSPREARLQAKASLEIQVGTTFSTLKAGVYRGAITLLYDDESPPSTISILGVITPKEGSPNEN